MYAYLQSLCMCPIRIMQYIFYVNTKTDLKTLRFKLLTTKVHNAQCNITIVQCIQSAIFAESLEIFSFIKVEIYFELSTYFTIFRYICI